MGSFMKWYVVLALWCYPLIAWAQSTHMTGVVFQHTVQKNQDWRYLSARFGIGMDALYALNQELKKKPLQEGQQVTIDNRHIVPINAVSNLLTTTEKTSPAYFNPAGSTTKNEPLNNFTHGIIVNIPQRMLFYYKDSTLVMAYPVAVGKAYTKTPLGAYTLDNKQKDKTWFVPVSIQREMEAQGKEVQTEVKPGPHNPLGRYWLGLSAPAVGIHGTNAPKSIYQYASHGCIRVNPEDIEQLYNTVETGIPVYVIYQNALLHTDPYHIFIEVHPDPYNKIKNTRKILELQAEQAQVSSYVDWAQVEAYIKQPDGRVHDVKLLKQALKP